MPHSAPLLAGLASTTMKIDGKCDRVRPLLAQALAADAGQWHSLWVLGDCFGMEGNKEKAEESYRRAVENAQFPDAKLLYSWGHVLEALGRAPTAIAAYERASKIDPKDENIRLRLRLLKNENSDEPISRLQ
jgi:tetratricopeptide (TPR) repeat protein